VFEEQKLKYGDDSAENEGDEDDWEIGEGDTVDSEAAMRVPGTIILEADSSEIDLFAGLTFMTLTPI